MRALPVLTLALALAGPAFAGPCRDHRYGSGYYRYQHFHRYHAPRLHARPSAYGYYPAWNAPGPCGGYGWHGGYGGHGWYGGYGYGGWYGYRYFRPVLRFSHVYTRAFTVLTIDDDAFSRAGTPAQDGLPQPRTEPVGSRFLVDTR